MSNKEQIILDSESKRVIQIALEKYQKELDKKIVAEKSELRSALYEEEKSLIRKSLRMINPVNKSLLPTLTETEQKN